MVGSKDLQPSPISFGKVFYNNQFREKPVWPSPGTNLSGKTAIITGGNTGLGYEATLQLLILKLSKLILAVRSLERGEAAAAKLRKLHPNAVVEVWQLDMCSYPSVQAFASRVDSQLSRIDIAILNAGGTRLEFTLNKSTRHEWTVQVNYLSTMLLALLLLPILILLPILKAKGKTDGSPARLTIVSAALTLAAKFPNKNEVPLLASFDDPKNFDQQETYNSSKLLAHMSLWKLVDYVSADELLSTWRILRGVRELN